MNEKSKDRTKQYHLICAFSLAGRRYEIGLENQIDHPNLVVVRLTAKTAKVIGYHGSSPESLAHQLVDLCVKAGDYTQAKTITEALNQLREERARQIEKITAALEKAMEVKHGNA